MDPSKLYHNGHLLVSAIRIIEHQKGAPPTLEEVCQLLSFSLEQGNLIGRKLQEMEIIEMVQGAYGVRLFVRNHLQLEAVKKHSGTTTLSAELKKFQDAKKDQAKKLEALQSEQAQKKKTRIADLEKELRKKLGGK